MAYSDSKRLRRAWRNMIRRCTVPTCKEWPNYGGRGITVCREWIDSFEAFEAHLGPRPFPDASIDRIENDLGYVPGNVRWASREIQNRNYRRNVWIDTPEGRMVIGDAATRFGIHPHTLHNRYHRGWPMERLLDPVQQRRQSTQY